MEYAVSSSWGRVGRGWFVHGAAGLWKAIAGRMMWWGYRSSAACDIELHLKKSVFHTGDP